MIIRSLSIRILLLTICSFFVFQLSAQPNLEEGKALFKGNCAQCHNKNMVDDLTGPALAGTEERWADYPREDLYKWIRNSQAMIADGHPRATQLWADWKPTVMNSFPNLTDEQIDNILGYINGVVAGEIDAPKVTGGGGVAVNNTADSGDNTLLFGTLFLILAVLSVILARIISNLNHISKVKEGVNVGPRATLMEVLTSKGLVTFLIFSLVVLGSFVTVNNAINLGRQQGYAPEQPIKFSHATHAGINKIDCQYCHDGARRSKHSVIPAANTCMNCHKAIKKGPSYGTAEISKIFASIGFNPNTDKYIEDYENMEEEEIEKVFREWITNNYLKDNDMSSLDNIGQREVDNQWKGIKTSLTNDQKKKIPGSIEWIRIHNLPDHAYFNHAQHVSVGKVECQECHGPVQEMEVVAQYSPLSMGWCVNCHRQTEVKFADNDYYEIYEIYHQELKDGTRDGVTVEDVGGLECQKCHY
ncbi:MAG: c-type cytochrome [Bacteroidota bacterium]